MDSKMPAAGLNISMVINETNFVSFETSIVWSIVLYSWIITLQLLYSCFRKQSTLLPSDRHNQHCSGKENVPASNVISAIFHDENAASQVIAREDVEIVMDNLGLYSNTNGDDRIWPKESFDEVSIANMFDEREASFDEVKEAFDVFDENRDGFIDVEELNKVMDSIGLSGFGEQELRKMIMAFDENGDGRIDFDEFVKLMGDGCF